jgi:hypothetical protein
MRLKILLIFGACFASKEARNDRADFRPQGHCEQLCCEASSKNNLHLKQISLKKKKASSPAKNVNPE